MPAPSPAPTDSERLSWLIDHGGRVVGAADGRGAEVYTHAGGEWHAVGRGDDGWAAIDDAMARQRRAR